MSKAQRAELKLPVIAAYPMIGSERRGGPVPHNAGECRRRAGVDARRVSAAEIRWDTGDSRAAHCRWRVGGFEGPGDYSGCTANGNRGERDSKGDRNCFHVVEPVWASECVA